MILKIEVLSKWLKNYYYMIFCYKNIIKNIIKNSLNFSVILLLILPF